MTRMSMPFRGATITTTVSGGGGVLGPIVGGGLLVAFLAGLAALGTWLDEAEPTVDAVVQALFVVIACAILAVGLATLVWMAVDRVRSRAERRKYHRLVAEQRATRKLASTAPRQLAPARQAVDQRVHQPRIKVTSTRQEVAP